MNKIVFEWDNLKNFKIKSNTAFLLKKLKQYFSMKTQSNLMILITPYAKNLKKQVTIRMGVDVIDYFKNLAEETGIPYQNLINLYLRDCVQSNRKLSLNWTQ